MKRVLLWLAGLCAFLSFASAQQTSTSNPAREAYQDRVAQELRLLRQQVDTAARSASQVTQQRFAPVYDAINDADEALAAFKTASTMDLSTRRAECDAALTRASRVWRDFKLVMPSAETTADPVTSGS